VGLPCLHSRSI